MVGYVLKSFSLKKNHKLPVLLIAGFWIKHYSYREQPRFKFKYEYLLILENQDLSVPSVICTTKQDIDPKFHFSDNCSLMKVSCY